MTARCGSCKADIVWAITVATGKRIPLDAQPSEDGNVAVHRDQVNGELIARVLKDGEQTGPWEHRGVSHFATCPNADQHRKRKKTEART